MKSEIQIKFWGLVESDYCSDMQWAVYKTARCFFVEEDPGERDSFLSAGNESLIMI